MTLREYLWCYGLSTVEFGKKIRYSENYISNCMTGNLKPGYKFVEDVVKATNGIVQPHEICCKRGCLAVKKEEVKEEVEQFTFAEIAN